jgi:hypothetical protein
VQSAQARLPFPPLSPLSSCKLRSNVRARHGMHLVVKLPPCGGYSRQATPLQVITAHSRIGLFVSSRPERSTGDHGGQRSLEPDASHAAAGHGHRRRGLLPVVDEHGGNGSGPHPSGRGARAVRACRPAWIGSVASRHCRLRQVRADPAGWLARSAHCSRERDREIRMRPQHLRLAARAAAARSGP